MAEIVTMTGKLHSVTLALGLFVSVDHAKSIYLHIFV